MTAIYARVSTIREERSFLERQLIDGEAWAKGNDLDHKVYVDIGSHKLLDQLLDDCTAGKIQSVWVSTITRLARSEEDLEKVRQTLKAAQVALYVEGKLIE